MNQKTETSTPEIDLELVARRVMELAQVCAEEHLAALARSQADGLMKYAREMPSPPGAGLN